MNGMPCKFVWGLALVVVIDFRSNAQQDVVPLTVESAASVGGSYVGLRFSGPVEVASAQNVFNYVVNGRFGNVPVTNATLRTDNESVLLALGGTITEMFTVRVNGVRDLAGLSIASDSTVAGEVWALGSGITGVGLGVPSVPGTNFSCRAGDVEVLAGGRDIWGVSDEFHFVYQRRTGDFDVAVLVEDLDPTEFRAKAGLMARETLNSDSRSVQIDTNPLGFPGAAEYQAHRRLVTGGTVADWGGEPETDLPNAWMRFKRVGNLFTGYHGTDGVNWMRMAGPYLQTLPAELFVGITTTSHLTNILGRAIYRNFGEVRSADPSIVGLLALEDQVVGVGDTVLFLAEVPGSSGHTFEWKKNGLVLPDILGALYRIGSVAKSDAGTISVRVRNQYGAVEIASAMLTVNEARVVLIPFTNVWSFEVSGADLGTAWKEASYSDLGWRTGPAPIGFETTPAALPMPVRTAIEANSKMTYYFRSKFTFTRDPADVYLNLKTLFDDGGVIYLNGTEFLRPLMGPALVNFNTPTTEFIQTAALDQWERLPSSLLVRGENVIAVEMHQPQTTSTDLMFALELIAIHPSPTRLAITNQPQDVIVEASKPAQLVAAISGDRGRYQWFRDGTAIAGATQAVYSVQSASPAHQGNYELVVSNVVNLVRSRTATLTVVPDALAPSVVKADGTRSPTAIAITFSEAVGTSSAGSLANYTITNMLGGTLPIYQAVVHGASNVVLTTGARQPDLNYCLLVRNIQDRGTPEKVIAADRLVPISSLVELIPAQTDWIYYDTIVDPLLVGTAWREPGYDDSTWYKLPAAFGLDMDAVSLPLPIRQRMSQGQFTTYFRHKFDFHAGAATSLRLRHYVDDGAVFYLNGVEVYRYNMPAGEVTDQTASAAVISKAAPIETNVPVSLMRFGSNLIAVELHAEEDLDRDLFFALAVEAEIESYPGGPLLILEHPRSQTIQEGQPVSFHVAVTGAFGIQWERDGELIAGANHPIYTISAVDPSMSGRNFAAVVTNASGTILRSQNATLTVDADDQGPVLLSAEGRANAVTLRFSEVLKPASVIDAAQYMVRNSAGQSFQIINADVGEASNEVILTTAELADGVNYTVFVSGVMDQALAPNAVSAGSQATFTAPIFTGGLVKAEYYGDDDFNLGWSADGHLLGANVGQLTSHPTFPSAPRFALLKNLWELSRSRDHANFFGARISGFFIPRRSGLHTFYLAAKEEGELWLSPDTHRAHRRLIARETAGLDNREWIRTSTGQEDPDRSNISVPINLIAGTKYYMESLMKADGGQPIIENMAVAVQEPGDAEPPVNDSSPIPAILIGGYWDVPATLSSITIALQPVSQTVESGQRALLRVGVHSSLPRLPGGNRVYYQWQRNGVDISGATSATYITPTLTVADDGAQYRVIVRTANGDAVSSEPAIVSVVSPGTPVFLDIALRADGNAVITWDRTGYLLQQTEGLPAFWGAAKTQVSPAIFMPNTPETFFRLTKQ